VTPDFQSAGRCQCWSNASRSMVSKSIDRLFTVNAHAREF
jgi:hypothetical protein